MTRSQSVSMSRRGLIGFGAAAGAAVVTGTPFAAHAVPTGIGPTPDDYTNAVTITLAPGQFARSLNVFDFNGFNTAGGSSNIFVGYLGGVWNSSGTGNFMSATLDLPVGALLTKVDVLGNRSSVGGQAWSLIMVNVVTGVDVVVGSSNLNSVNGATQGTITLNRAVAPGETYVVRLDNTDANSRAVGVVYQYSAPGSAFVAVAPRRVYDSRKDTAGKLARGATRTVNVATEYQTTNSVVPAGATAIAYNITVTDTESGFGFLSVAPGGSAPSSNSSSINWSAAKTSLANGLVVGINAAREINVLCDGAADAKTNFLIDVLGYYV
jgi:hypothetical protein